jgi:hypothetical protein
MPRTSQATQSLVAKIRAMRIGASFFVEGVTREDVEFLRRPLKKLGVGAKFVETEYDEIYLCHGVRIWREEGPYDEL